MKVLLFGLVPLFLFACAPNSLPDPKNDEMLEAPPKGQGLQLRMTKTIGAGVESYGCQLFQMPDDDMWVHEQTVQFSRGGHHILLYTTPYAAIPESDENGSIVDAGDVHDCSEGVTARWKVDSVLGGSEIFEHPGMFRGLPDGVALRLPKKSVIIMSVHYLNASADDVMVDARVNLSTIPREKVHTEAGLLYLDNHLLHVPSMGSSIATMSCPVPSDVFVANLQSHMHARGVSFQAVSRDNYDHEQRILYETTKWLEPPVLTFDPYLALHTGQRVEMRCAYENHELREVGYGPNSTDEMCQLIGPYFPRNDDFGACASVNGALAARWIGQGNANGATTRSCFECAGSNDSIEYAACIDDACPSIADEVSAVVRCEMTRGIGACDGERAALSKATCQN